MGNVTNTTFVEGNEIPYELNHIMYRGYYRDSETGFYYLQSRYYDAKVGRFINADDAIYLGFSGTVWEYNLYIYCENNPVNYTDYTGNYVGTLRIDYFIVQVLSSALAGIIAGIGTSMASVKAAISTSWIPAVCIAAAAVAIVGIVYTVNKARAISKNAENTKSIIVSRVSAGGDRNPKGNGVILNMNITR